MIKKLLLSVLAIFGFALFMSQNSYAASWSYSLTSIGSDGNLSDLGLPSGFQIKSVQGSLSTFSGSGYGAVNLQTSRTSGNLGYRFSTYISSGVVDNITSICLDEPLGDMYLSSWNSGSFTFSYDFVFSDVCDTGVTPSGTLNITENGTFDVTNYASAVVNVDQTISDLPPYSELVVDSFWKYHVAIAGGLASIFAVFVVYRIIRSRLR